MKITFIDGKDKIVYKPLELDGYGYELKSENEFGEDSFEWRHYKSKKAISFAPKFYASKNVFMEVMEEGEIILYDYYVETPRDIENPYKRYFYIERASTGEWTELSEDNYVDIAALQFEDHDNLSDKIGNVNHRFRHLWKVVRLYNDWNEMQDMTRAADFDTENTSKTVVPF